MKRRDAIRRASRAVQLELPYTERGGSGIAGRGAGGTLLEIPTPLSRATTGKRKCELGAPRPWRCVVLGVDTARMSGWAIAFGGAHIASGEVDTLDEPTLGQIVWNACTLAGTERVPVVLVLETPWGGSADIVAALGAARERWLRAWRICGEATGRVVYVRPGVWRGPILGRKWVSAPRNEVRAQEQAVARMRLAVGGARAPFVGADEAPAILIAWWASQARAVGRVIGKRAVKASLRAWGG